MSHKSKSQMYGTAGKGADFRKGYEQTFGEKKPQRGRWVYTSDGKAVPAEEYVPPHVDSGRVPVVTDRYMEGTAATDGTDISSRKKRREYMKANNLADADDFKGTWAKAETQRAEYRQGQQKNPAVREALGRALHAVRSKR